MPTDNGKSAFVTGNVNTHGGSPQWGFYLNLINQSGNLVKNHEWWGVKQAAIIQALPPQCPRASPSFHRLILLDRSTRITREGQHIIICQIEARAQREKISTSSSAGSKHAHIASRSAHFFSTRGHWAATTTASTGIRFAQGAAFSSYQAALLNNPSSTFSQGPASRTTRHFPPIRPLS